MNALCLHVAVENIHFPMGNTVTPLTCQTLFNMCTKHKYCPFQPRRFLDNLRKSPLLVNDETGAAIIVIIIIVKPYTTIINVSK